MPTLKGLEPSTSVLGGPRATIAPKGQCGMTNLVSSQKSLKLKYKGNCDFYGFWGRQWLEKGMTKPFFLWQLSENCPVI